MIVCETDGLVYIRPIRTPYCAMRQKYFKEIMTMKRLSKVLATALAVMMLCGIAIPYASADLAKEPRADDGGSIYVSLRIEGAEALMYYNEAIEIAADSTVLGLMEAMDENVDTLEITIDSATYGYAYVPKINGLAESDYDGYSGWMFLINGVSGNEGIADAVLSDGDAVVFYYSDQWGAPGFQFPDVDVSRLLSDGVIRFTSEDTDYDDDWNPITATKPIIGATVVVGVEKFTTDDNGEIFIDDVSGLAGLLPLIIEKYDAETGVPTVLRYAPGYEIYVPFADAPLGAWYDDAIEFCVGERLFIGFDAESNLFAPINNMTMLQLFTVLNRIAGPEPTLSPIEWALANDIASLPGELGEMNNDMEALHDFFSAALATRSGIIHMFYLTVDLAGSHDMTVRADITAATDYDEIVGFFGEDSDVADAISWAVASGIIKGVDANALTINFAAEVTRAEVCQMLLNYYS